MDTRLNQPLRIFFGHFLNAALYYAQVNGDQVFPDFLTGARLVGAADTKLHTRQPAGPLGDITTFDEYLDIQAARLDIATAETIKNYQNLSGVQSQMYWVDTTLKYDPTNTLIFETDGIEFANPTRRLSLPYPKTAPVAPPKVFISNPDLTTTILGYIKLWVTLWDSGGTNESSPSIGVTVPYSTTTDNITLTVLHDGTTANKYSIYRAPTDLDSFRQQWLLRDYGKLLNSYNKAAVPSITSFTVTADFADTTAVIYEATPTYLIQPALNDARARVKFDFLARRRFSGGIPTQHWLVLNLENHHYYKGGLSAVSPLFMSGFGKGNQQAIIHMFIREEGLFVDDALTDPNTLGYFSTFDRSYIT